MSDNLINKIFDLEQKVKEQQEEINKLKLELQVLKHTL